MKNLENVKNHPTMVEVLADSFGGCMYDVSNVNKYDGESKNELLSLWDALSASEQSMLGGAVKGAVDFLKGN